MRLSDCLWLYIRHKALCMNIKFVHIQICVYEYVCLCWLFRFIYRPPFLFIRIFEPINLISCLCLICLPMWFVVVWYYYCSRIPKKFVSFKGKELGMQLSFTIKCKRCKLIGFVVYPSLRDVRVFGEMKYFLQGKLSLWHRVIGFISLR